MMSSHLISNPRLCFAPTIENPPLQEQHMASADIPNGALSDVRVLDVSNFMAGPTAAMYLGDFGAQIIKVEHPRGDGFRHWGRTREGDPLFWKILSRNKRCITLNFSKPKGQQLLKALVRKSDVLVEN